MALNPPSAPTLPDLGDRSTFNSRSLAQFSFAAQLRNWLAGVNASNFFDVLGQVREVNGDATGALMERGATANGTYERFANGLQICRASLDFPAATMASGSIFVSTSDLVWTFPAAFIARPSVSGNRPFTGPHWLIGSEANNEVPLTRYRGRIASTFSVASRTMDVAAVGRWF